MFVAYLSLSLSVAEGGPIKDTQNKVLNLEDHIVSNNPVYYFYVHARRDFDKKLTAGHYVLLVLITKKKNFHKVLRKE